MKRSCKPAGHRNLDKHLFEAGNQCHKRLWLDIHDPAKVSPPAIRRKLSEVGQDLRRLAQTAFPKGISIQNSDLIAAAEATTEQLDQGASVLFDAAFIADGIEARCDILVAHKDKYVDLFEVKSGTKVNRRYVNDLALQAAVVTANGYTVQRAYLLHMNPSYTHNAGDEYPPMQLLRSSDVTSKVKKQQPSVTRDLELLRQIVATAEKPKPPMGTYCSTPIRCPHIDHCIESAPALPLHYLPGLTRQQERELHKDGIEHLAEIPTVHEGLTSRQRLTLESHAKKSRIIDAVVSEELAACDRPLHFLASMSVTDPLPRFDQQRPWQPTPFAWAIKTVHEDGSVESQSFVKVDREDPRSGFVKTLSRHLESGGTALVWGSECLRAMRPLLNSIPDGKSSIRALLGHDQLDLRALFESAIFEPKLHNYGDFASVIEALLGDDSGHKIQALDPNERFELVQKTRGPRLHKATRDKIGATIKEALTWQTERLSKLFELFSTAS